MQDADVAALGQAQRVVYRAKLRYLHEAALARLAGQPGLVRTPLYPPSPVIRIVGYRGAHIGRVRRESPPGQPKRWTAVPSGPVRPFGPYPSDRAAAAALLRWYVTQRTPPGIDAQQPKPV